MLQLNDLAQGVWWHLRGLPCALEKGVMAAAFGKFRTRHMNRPVAVLAAGAVAWATQPGVASFVCELL